MERRRTILILLGLSMVLMAVSGQAMPVSYVFRVTATTGPLAGVTAKGRFTFDDSLIPVGGGGLPQIDLLSYLNFTWNGIAYDQTTANTGVLQFDASGNLSFAAVGTIHTAGGVGLIYNQEGWIVTGTGFAYAITDGSGIWDGTVSIRRAQPVLGDYDGDSKTDISVYRASTGAWYIYPSGSGAPYGLAWGGDPTDKSILGDYDGDSKTDISVYRASTGVWYVIPSSGAAPYAVGWGLSNDIPVPGDYDGDGKTDLAVYGPSTRWWNITPSGGGVPYRVGWPATPMDKPIPGDYDGDSKTDCALYLNGMWFIYPSGGGVPYVVGWGGDATDKTVPRDYDGDGKTDLAVYRDGVWFISPSGGGTPYAMSWGIAGDKPVPGDYDGDGKADVAVYRPDTGVWYIVPSGGGSPYGVGWGGDPSDIPLTANTN